MGGSHLSYISLPCAGHSAVICGQTGCGKTEFCLDLLEGPYREVFRHIVILCPTIKHNVTYQGRPWVWSDPEVYIIDPGERLHDWLRFWYHRFQASRPCTSSTIVAPRKRWRRREIPSPNWPSLVATPSSRFGCCLSDTTPSSRICESRPSGWPCSIARTETLSKSASARMT